MRIEELKRETGYRQKGGQRTEGSAPAPGLEDAGETVWEHTYIRQEIKPQEGLPRSSDPRGKDCSKELGRQGGVGTARDAAQNREPGGGEGMSCPLHPSRTQTCPGRPVG